MTNIEKHIDDIAENQGAWYEDRNGCCECYELGEVCMFKSMGCPGVEQESEGYHTPEHGECERVFKKWALEEAGK